MGEKDDGLGLSLSLGCTTQKPSLNLNLMHASSSMFMENQNQHHQQIQKQKTSWNELFQPSDRSSETRTLFLRGIDVNHAPPPPPPPPPSSTVVVDFDEDVGVSSPNSTISSSISGKRSEREPNNNNGDENDASCSRGLSDEEEDGGDGSGGRKKLRLSKDQSAVLEETFKEHSTLNPKQKLALAKQLNLRPRQVEVWFQNRRARTKLKQTEVDCEYLKRCCENLTEENRRLQKEVQELRALKLSPQFYMQMNPPTTLTMCPSCEKVAVSSSSSSSAAAAAAASASAAAKLTLSVGGNPRPHNPAVTPQIQRPIPINPWASKLLQGPRS